MTRRATLMLMCVAASISIDALVLAAPGGTPAAPQSADPATVLATHNAASARREEAARALLVDNSDAARQAIARALDDSSDPLGQLAAAKAVASARNPDPSYLSSLWLMLGPDRTMTDVAIQAIANYRDNPEALRLLVRFASSRQQQPADRIDAIRAIGTSTDKAAAEFLMSLVMREDDAQRIRNAAADTLADMTGQVQNGRDPKSWQAWWVTASARNDAQWKQDIITNHAARFAQIRQQYEQLTGELQSILSHTYELTPPAQQPALMLSYLRSTNPEIRRLGALIMLNDATAAKPVAQECREQLRTMVGDSSRDVRLAVANALLATNDPGAFDALLRQLQRESDPEVRAALAAPLAALGDVRAVPTLRALLQDKSTTVAAAAASALRELGPVIQNNHTLARDIARDLRTILDHTGSDAASLPFKEAIAEALVPLRDPDMIPTLYSLLRESASTRIRWAALRGLGELGDPKTADTIARYLEDREPGVRLEAIRALGKTSATESARELFQHMNAVNEPDQAIREEAWKVLQTTFSNPKMPLSQLPEYWVTQFPDDPIKRAVVLRAWIDRATDPQQLATARQALGVALLEQNLSADAAGQFKQALDYFSAQPNQDVIVERLVEQYLVALIRARNFSDAQTFAGQLLTQRASYQQTVGVVFRNEAQHMSEARRGSDVQAIAEAARKITPPLAQRYLDEVNTIEQDARQHSPSTQPLAP